MSALDNLLDARVSHSEIALWLGISTHAVRLRMIERERGAMNSTPARTLSRTGSHQAALSINGVQPSTHCQNRSASLCAKS